jgi:cell wall-associated NlpC family hydrolase
MLARWCGDYVGLPFREHGRGDGGYDCWGLVRKIYAEQYGICLPSLVDRYDGTTSKSAIQMADVVKDTARDWMDIAPGREQEGDVISLRFYGHPVHVGVVIGGGMMLHVMEGIDSCVEMYDRLKWRNKVAGFYRHAERR